MGTSTVGMVVVPGFAGSLPARVKVFEPAVWVKVGTVPCASVWSEAMRRESAERDLIRMAGLVVRFEYGCAVWQLAIVLFGEAMLVYPSP